MIARGVPQRPAAWAGGRLEERATRLGRADEVATFKARLAILRGRVQAGFSGVGLEMAIDAFADEYDAFVEGVLPPR
jgi:hypothetical protein